MAGLICTGCRLDKSEESFHKDKRRKRGYAFRCKVCIKEYQHKLRSQQKAEIKTKNRLRYLRNKDRILAQTKQYKLRTKYGTDVAEFERMKIEQGGNCVLCGKPFDGSIRGSLAPVIDHDHKTGIIRGILHNACNRHLGIYEIIREKAEVYLNKDTQK